MLIVKRKIFLLLAGSVLFLPAFGCITQEKSPDGAQRNSAATGSLTDKPLAPYRNDLLNLAFETASAIPATPHIKDRSRAQEKVVAASLELDQPRRALGLIQRIDNWRRGAGYCDLAFYYARHGYAGEAQQYLNLAVETSESAEDWRKDQIRVKIANTHVWLGRIQQADQFESGKAAGVSALIACEDHFDEQMNALDALIAPGNFDVVESALKAYANLFNRFYYDAWRRSLVEEKMKTSWDKLPVFKRVELLTDLAGFALEHADQTKALELVNEAQFLIEGAQWPPEHQISLASKLARLRYRAGDTQKALTEADALLALFASQRNKIVNIDRTGTLLPLAEAYQSMGDTKTALTIYKQAVEEGVENPNSRPRAEDLSAACCSMALYSVEPDAALWARILQINKELGNPW